MFLQILNNFLETHEILPVYVNNDDKLLLEENHSLKPEKEMKSIRTTKQQQSNDFQEFLRVGKKIFMILSVRRPVFLNVEALGINHKEGEIYF
jgi:hypothetical protein